MRKTVLALAVAALATPAAVTLATPARAQMGGMPNLMSEGVKLKTQEEVDAEKAREKGFKDGLNKIPNAQGKKDPWGNVRGDSAQAPPKASASNQPKTSASNRPKPSASNQPKPDTK